MFCYVMKRNATINGFQKHMVSTSQCFYVTVSSFLKEIRRNKEFFNSVSYFIIFFKTPWLTASVV